MGGGLFLWVTGGHAHACVTGMAAVSACWSNGSGVLTRSVRVHGAFSHSAVLMRSVSNIWWRMHKWGCLLILPLLGALNHQDAHFLPSMCSECFFREVACTFLSSVSFVF